ncbi:MAG TPA: class I SAM-dependent methyltransferase, partial [Pseudomonadales bacterium]|nr:class I SAM-dependent methyltransferase [Pseudomonadales bacterium]
MSEHSWPFRMGPFFDHVANQYDGVQVSNIDDGKGYYVAIAEPIEPTDDVVDVWSIGAGTGLDLVSILKRIPNARVNCVDVAPKMLERLRNRFAKTT